MSGSEAEDLNDNVPEGPPPSPEPPTPEALAAAIRFILNGNVHLQQPSQPDATAIRKGKFTKLYEMLKFKSKLQSFNPSDKIEIREWLDIFDVEISSIARNSCQLDTLTDPLTNKEYMELLSTKLSHSVKR